ncbi:N-acetylmuramoyl-L-alanine amidase AmiA, partial [Dysosmobacter welbionis]
LVGHHQQGLAAGEQVPLEVRPQAVADDGDAQVIHQTHQVHDLLPGQKLGLVHDDAGVLLQFHDRELLHLVKVDAGIGEADAGNHHVVPVPGIQPGLDQQGLLPPLLVVEPGHQGVCGLAGTHGPVFEIELCHLSVFSLSMYLLMRHSAAFSLVPVPSAGRDPQPCSPRSIFRWASRRRCSSSCSAAFSDVRGLGISSSGISITILRQPRQSQAVLYLLKRLPSWRISISGPLAPKNRLGQPGHHWTLSRPP